MSALYCDAPRALTEAPTIPTEPLLALERLSAGYGEPSLGLAPAMVLNLFQIIRSLKTSGLTLLLIEVNLRMARAIGDDAYVLSEGHIVLSGAAPEVRDHPDVRRAYLGAVGPARSQERNRMVAPLAPKIIP